MIVMQPTPATPNARQLRSAMVVAWCIDLTRAGNDTDGLCPEEQARARGIKHAARRAEFMATRKALRQILAYHLGGAPSAIEFEVATRGKPFLREPASTGIEFNVSHSEGLALIAVGRDREIGVDVERIRPKAAMSRLASRFFTAQEQQRLGATNEAERLELFYEIWCRKEAVLKAFGAGITSPLDKLDVLGGVVTLDGLFDVDEEAPGPVRLQALAPAPTHVAALAYTGDLAEVCFHRWNPDLPHQQA